MGLFYERRSPSPELVNQLATALAASPSDAAATVQRATELAGNIGPVVRTFATALATPPPADPVPPAQAQAQALADELLGGATFNTGRFIVTLLIFTALLVGGIVCEVNNLSTATGTLFTFAGTMFGIVAAFLGAEKGSN
jgi:hypothetical protein